MALIKCPDCGKEISDKAASCIHCGCPIHSAKDSSIKQIVVPSFRESSNKSLTNITMSVMNIGFSEAFSFLYQERPVVYTGSDEAIINSIVSQYAAAGIEVKVEQESISCGTGSSRRIILIGKYDKSISKEVEFTTILPHIEIGEVGKYLYLDGEKVVADGVSPNYANILSTKLQQSGFNVRIEASSKELIYDTPSKSSGKIACPQCGSLEYTSGTRGYSIITGFIGSGKTMLTCLHCGHRWKPGK